MPWIKPKSTLGTEDVAAGSPMVYDPTPVVIPGGGIGRVVVVQIQKTVPKSKIEDGPAPPDTSQWNNGRLLKTIPFDLDDRARGQVVNELPGGLVLVDFTYVSGVVADEDIQR